MIYCRPWFAATFDPCTEVAAAARVALAAAFPSAAHVDKALLYCQVRPIRR